MLKLNLLAFAKTEINQLKKIVLTFFGREFDSELCFLVGLIEAWERLSGIVGFELSDGQELRLVLSLVVVAAAVEPNEVFVEVGREAVMFKDCYFKIHRKGKFLLFKNAVLWHAMMINDRGALNNTRATLNICC